MLVMLVASVTAIAARKNLRGGKTGVKRHWPGKAPECAEEAEEDVRMQKLAVLDRAFPKHDALRFAEKDDPRLRRLAHTRTENREEVRADHRRIRHADIISTKEEELRNQETRDEEEDEDALEERRRRTREKSQKSSKRGCFTFCWRRRRGA